MNEHEQSASNDDSFDGRCATSSTSTDSQPTGNQTEPSEDNSHAVTHSRLEHELNTAGVSPNHSTHLDQVDASPGILSQPSEHIVNGSYTQSSFDNHFDYLTRYVFYIYSFFEWLVTVIVKVVE